MRFRRAALALFVAFSGPALALDSGQRVSTPKDPSPNLNRPVVKQLTVPDGPASLILGSKTLSDFLPSVDSDGNMTVLPGRKIGRVQDGKFISQPDAVQIQGSGSTGDITSTSAAPSDGRGAGTLGAHLGRTSARFFPENYDLPGDEAADAYAAITAAINAARPVPGEVVLRQRTYSLLTTVLAPTDVTIRFEGATLKPLRNISVLQIGHRSTVDGWGLIEVGGVAGYSAAAVIGLGSDNITSGQIRGNIRIWNSSGSHTGIGYQLHSPNNGRVIYYRAEFDEIRGFAVGAKYSAAGSGFTNSNYLMVGSIYDNVEGIVTEVDNPIVAGAAFNFFEGTIQPALIATRALRVGSQGNQFNMMIWDWHGTASPDTAITFSPGSKNNRVRSPIPWDQIQDQSSAYRVDANIVEDWLSTAPLTRSVLPPSLRFQTFSGNQDDIFAFADKRSGWTVSQTSGSAPVEGAISSAFDLDATTSAKWTTASAYPIIIEIDFGTKAPGYLLGLGASFGFGGVPPSISFDTFDGTTWTTQRAFTSNGRAQVSWQSNNFVVNVKKVRMVIAGPPDGGTIYLERFFGFGTVKDGGYAWRPAFTDAPLVLRDGGQPVPTPIPGYAQMYRDPADFKWKLMEGNGTVRTFVFQ